MADLFNTLRWGIARRRALERDGERCTVNRLLGGACAGRLHVHHIVPRGDGGTDALDNLGTVCAAHHPAWEALRRTLLERREPVRRRPQCRHRHRTAEGRAACERRLAREYERRSYEQVA